MSAHRQRRWIWLIISTLPTPNIRGQRRQRRNFLEKHIDGHASLVADSDDKPHLLVAKSYFKQDSKGRKQIQSAAQKSGAELHVIDDAQLPHLAFNLIQLRDSSIICTGVENAEMGTSYSIELIDMLRSLVGDDNVHPTRVPIEYMPLITKAGIRCLTNIADQELIAFLEKNSHR